jgi:two-component system sensor histidine kinase KdpD
VSSVVHLAARRHALATALSAEAGTLLELAQTVLGGQDTPDAVLAHLTASLRVRAELQEQTGGRWVGIAGVAGHGVPEVVAAGPQLRLALYGDIGGISPRLLDGYAAQAAAALERQRLRMQAGQAAALAEGNRMRTALMTAVSHDLRTPLATVKAAVSTLRQTDVAWTAENQAELLATIEDGADRLDTLIANLLDMSRLQTGSVQPFLRPTALDEVAPLLVAGLDGGEQLRFEIPDAMPLLNTDPGLLERALANLAANALRYSPPGRPPSFVARADRDRVTLRIIDHGPGIAPSDRAQAFEPFQQLGDQRTGTGVGLGLAVAKGFIDALAGRLVAESTPGGGLTMRVDLPIAAAPVSPASGHEGSR